jgi:hypothetical protein
MPLKQPNMFVTVACVRGGPGPDIECAVAGHFAILRTRAGVVEEITTPQLAVGMFEDAAGVRVGQDAPGAAADRPLPKIADRLLAHARNHGAQTDDQTALLIRRGRPARHA